jgi:hypothetical protein
VDDISRLIEFLQDPSSGTRQSQDEYGRDFAERLWLADTRDTWKLERMQFYDELVSLCGVTLYATEYDDAAKPGGARRFTDREVIATYESLAGELFSSGEDLESYFDREVAPFPPPIVG